MRKRIVLYADEGIVLTDGTNYGTVIWLAEGANPDTYYPISIDEYNAILAERESDSESTIENIEAPGTQRLSYGNSTFEMR